MQRHELNRRSFSPFPGLSISQLLLLKLLLFTALICAGCAQMPPVNDTPPQFADPLAAEDVTMLSQTTIFFGHQSVGGNVLQGVEEIVAGQPDTPLKVVEITSPSAVEGAGFFHTLIGQNYDPIGKIKHFDQLMREGIGGKANIAFFKFCYVDFDRNTDVDGLFTSYKQTMDDLARSYPQTTFVHVTVPLTVQGNGFKIFVKGLLGRDDLSTANLQRHRFNELLRQEYTGKAPIFDLAKFESIMPDGKACSMRIGSQSVPCLFAEYTYDGGHLNEPGRTAMAEQLLAFLVKTAQ